MKTYCDICKFARRIADPSPDDWFEDDDEMMVCSKCEGRVIERAMRPYEKHGKDSKPNWCPLQEE